MGPKLNLIKSMSFQGLLLCWLDLPDSLSSRFKLFPPQVLYASSCKFEYVLKKKEYSPSCIHDAYQTCFNHCSRIRDVVWRGLWPELGGAPLSKILRTSPLHIIDHQCLQTHFLNVLYRTFCREWSSAHSLLETDESWDASPLATKDGAW